MRFGGDVLFGLWSFDVGIRICYEEWRFCKVFLSFSKVVKGFKGL